MLVRISFFVLLSLLIGACGADNDSRPAAVNEVAVEAAPGEVMRKLVNSHYQALKRGDWNNNLYSEDVVLIVPGQSPFHNIDSVRGARSIVKGQYERPGTLTVQRAQSAEQIGQVWATLMPEEGPAAEVIFLLERGEDWQWRIVLEMWNGGMF